MEKQLEQSESHCDHFVFRHFAVTNGFMTSVSYPQMAQGLPLQSNELGALHDQTLMNSLSSSTNRPATSLSHFYHEISKQPTTGTAISPAHKQFSQNENLSIRSLSNSIEII